jgi:putative DNA methylase
MADHPVKRRKKLIEVAIPLEAINAASAREKSIRQGHPSTLHLWWSRKPLATARSVIFCQMVDDPSAVPEEFPTDEAQENERLRLFALISKLVIWENTSNEEVLEEARAEIRRSWRRACADNIDHPEAAELFNPEILPGFHDPFAGGGALPLEAQRLGLEAYASDLNPVAVLINKAMIEIPPKFAGMPPVNPEARSKKQLIDREWRGAEGLAEDLRYYGKWMRDEARKRIGHLYPNIEVTAEMAINRPDLKPYIGQKLTVIAWVWARTVRSPNPAFSTSEVPLTSNFWLSKKKGKEAYILPVVNQDAYFFTVKTGAPLSLEEINRGTSAGKRSAFKCILSGTPIPYEYIRNEGREGRIGARLMAIVAEGKRGRVYLDPAPGHEELAKAANPKWIPDIEISHWPGRTNVVEYGLTNFSNLFTGRQLLALNAFSELIKYAKFLIENDNSLLVKEEAPLDCSQDSAEYSDAISVYLAFVLSKQADLSNSLNMWEPLAQCPRHLFGQQSIPMIWSFAEANPLGESSGSWEVLLNGIVKALHNSFGSGPSNAQGNALVMDAGVQVISARKIVSTDPPYYDNIGYADLSDFFYVWLRHALKDIIPGLFLTLAAPKAEELVATPYRHGGKKNAEDFFLRGMTSAMSRISMAAHPGFPVTIYYAFKQAETKRESGTASTGWETFLAALIDSGFSLNGTWPMRTENASRMIGQGANALASSILLACRPKGENLEPLSRSEFRRMLRKELPSALQDLEKANVAPVDLAQAAIGPGIAIFSNVRAVLNPDDSPMSVREALVEINSALDEYLSQDEGDLDADSRFALTFFMSYGYEERSYGDAEGLAIARNLSVDGVAEAGILSSVAGKVRLYQRAQLPDNWDPTTDRRLCVWEATQHLIKRLEASGEGAAADLLLQLKSVSGHGDLAANCRALAYRLYNHCEKKKQAEEARSYNGLVIAWPELERLASASSTSSFAPRQTTLI